MPKPLNILAMVLPVLGSALVACVDGLPEESAAGNPSDPSAVNAAPTESSSSSSSSSSASTPSPSPSADAGTVDAAKPNADASADAGSSTNVDASVDAGADSAPPPPAYDCNPISLTDSAPSPTCSISTSQTWAGGTFVAGTYNLTEWSDGTSTCVTPGARQGTMYLEQKGDSLYMRWIRTTDTSTATGTALLEPSTNNSVVRTELCNKKAIVLAPSAIGYTVTTTASTKIALSTTTITFANGKGYEKWTRLSKIQTLPPITTEPVIVAGP